MSDTEALLEGEIAGAAQEGTYQAISDQELKDEAERNGECEDEDEETSHIEGMVSIPFYSWFSIFL